MGLDITVYRGLRQAKQGVQLSRNMDCFAPRGEGLDLDAVYEYADTFGFRAGSYSGYNDWREQLAKLAGYPAAPHKDYDGKIVQRHAQGAWDALAGPFWELINFADNEGTIGPVLAKKLARDFAMFENDADATGDAWFIARYADWKRAFEMASDGGAVEFH